MDELSQKIDRGYKFLLASRVCRSISMIYVTLSLPLYLLSLNVRISFVGLLFFAMISISVFIALFAGMIGDRIGYRYSLIIADVPLIIATFLLSHYDSLIVIELATIVGGVGGAPGGMRGVFAPGMTAIIARNYPKTQKRVSRMGMLMSVGSIASIGGSGLLYGGHILVASEPLSQQFRTFYLLSMILAICSLIFVYLTPERKGEKKKQIIMGKSSGKYTSKVLVSNVIQGSSLGLGITLLPAWIELRYGLSVPEIGLIFTISYIATAAGALVATYVPMKQDPVTYGSVSRVVQGIFLLSMAFMPTAALFAVVYSCRQVFGGYGAPIRSAVNVRGIKSEDFGTASSIQGLGTRASQGTSVASGYLAEISLPIPEILGGVIQSIGGYVYYKLLHEQKNSIEDQT